MMMRGWLTVLLAAAAAASCYSPPAVNGQTDAATPDAAVDASIDAAISIDGCTPQTVVCGDGIDQNCDGADEPCPINDRATGAIDISAGGDFTTDVRFAKDDLGNTTCGGAGGRDVYFEINLPARETVYFDTFGSDFDSMLRIYPGKRCLQLGGGIGGIACADDACGSGQEQTALSLPSGRSCIVVDQQLNPGNAGEFGALKMHVIRTGRDAVGLEAAPSPIDGDTCTGTLSNSASLCGAGVNTDLAKDVAYFVLACPAQTVQLVADTCAGTNFDSVLTVNTPTAETFCNDDSANCAATNQASKLDVVLANALIHILTVDGVNPQCGAYSLAYTITRN